MLSKEVLGWRVLAVLLLLLIIPTIPQFEYIQNEWENSIDNLEKEEENQSENEFSTETEPPEENHPLIEAPNCIITSHIASRTHESVARQAGMATQNLISYLKGENNYTQANKF